MLNRLIFIVLGLIIFVHCFILTKLIYFPYPELFIYPYLTNHGLKPYSQILDQHFPGLLFLPINFDNLGMNNENIARIWSIVIVILTHFMLFFISYKILRSKRKALLANFLYLLWQPFFEGWVLWIDSFLPLILLPAFYALYKKKLLLSGLLLGVGIVFKQTLIPLTLLVIIYQFWSTKKINESIRFSLGVIGPVGLMLTYLFSIGVLADFWYWTVVFNLTTYAKFGTSTPPSVGYVTRVIFVYLGSFPAMFNKDKRLIKILFVFLLGSLIGIFDRADFVHFQPSLPFVLLSTVLGVYSIKRNNLFRVGVLGYIFVTLWWQQVFYKGHISDKVLLFDSQVKDTAIKIKQNTHPGERIFVFGAVPHLYQLSNTLPAGDIFVFQFPWFLKIAQDRILAGLKKDKPQIVVSDRTFTISNMNITQFADKIDQYIQENYEIISKVGTTDVMRLKNK